MPILDLDNSTVHFDDAKQSELFLEFLNNTKIIAEGRHGYGKVGASLKDNSLENQNQKTFTLNILTGNAIISKFMQVTGMYKMDYEKYFGSDYKLEIPKDKRASQFKLGRYGLAEIDSKILKKMQDWKKNTKTPEIRDSIELIKAYYLHLQEKCDKERLRHIEKHANSSSEQTQKKLTHRYEAISQLYEKIKGKDSLDENDKKMAKEALKICIKNAPDWKDEEGSFLKKLKAIFSLNLYHRFFSDEKKFEQKLDKNLSNDSINNNLKK